MHNHLSIFIVQNEMMHNANKKLKDDISEFKERYFAYLTGKRSNK